MSPDIEQPQPRPSSALRGFFIACGAIMLALWGASTIPVIENWNNPNEDGFDAVLTFYATLTVLPLGVGVLYGAIAGDAKGMRGARSCLIAAGGVLAIVLAIDMFRRLAIVMDWG
jgi:hypothetical protein